MSHTLTFSLVARGGVVPHLKCTEPPGSPCRMPYPEHCNIVEVFEWDSAVSIEGYYGPEVEIAKFNIHVTAATEEDFDWELAGVEPEFPAVGSGGDNR